MTIVRTTSSTSSYTDEQAQDASATLFTTGTHSGISFAYDDTNAKVNATVSGGAGTSAAFDARSYLPGGSTVGDGTGDRAAVQGAVNAAVAAIAATGRPATVDLADQIWYLNTSPTKVPVQFPGRPVGIYLPVNLSAQLTIRNGTIKLSDANARIAFWPDQGGGYTTSGSTTNGSATVTAPAEAGAFAIGQVIEGTGIPNPTKITNVSGNTLTLSQAATATGTGVTLMSWAYDVFRNVTLSDITVNNNSATGRCSVLLGNRPAADTTTKYLSFQNLTIRRCSETGVPDDPTQGTTYKGFIELIGVHKTAGETTQTYSRDITIEDCTIRDSQNGVIIVTYNGTPSNHYHDNVRIRRCTHVRSVVPAAWYQQTSYYIGGGGIGGYCEFVDLYSENIGDDAIEVGALQHIVIDRLRSKNPYLCGILFRNSQPAPQANTQTITVRDSYFETTSALGAINGAKGRPMLFSVDTAGDTLGEVRLVRCQARYDGRDWVNSQAINEVGLSVYGPVRRAEFIGCSAVITNYNFNNAGGPQDHYVFYADLTSTSDTIATFRDCSAYVTGVTSSTSTNPNFFGVAVERANRVVVDGFDWQVDTARGNYYAGAIGYFSTRTNRWVTFSRVTGKAVNINNGSGHGIRLSENGTIQAGSIERCDLRDLFSSTDVERTANGANNNVVVERNMVYGATPTSTTETVTASPFAYRNTTGIRRTVTVSGGTVSLIELGNAAATYTTTGVTSGVFSVGHGEYLRVTYSVAPTVRTIPVI